MPSIEDYRGNECVTERNRDIEFINDMEAAEIPWHWYSGRGMMGRSCPAAVTSSNASQDDIIRATTVENLRRDSLGFETIVYTG